MPRQWISIPFVGGLDERTAKQYVDPRAKQSQVVNGEFVRIGALDQRLGLENLPKTIISGNLTSPTQGLRITNWSRSGLTALGSGGLYTYSEANEGLVGVAKIPDVKVTRKPLVSTPTFLRPVLTDVMTSSGRQLRLSTYLDDSRNILATVHDLETGDVVVQPTIIYDNPGAPPLTFYWPTVTAQFALPNAASAANRCKIFIYDSFTFRFYRINFNPDALTFSSALQIATQSFSYITLSPWYIGPFYNTTSDYIFMQGNSSKTTFTIQRRDENDNILTSAVSAIPAGHETDFPMTGIFHYSAGNTEKCWVAIPTVNTATFQGQVWLYRFSSEGTFTQETGPVQITASSFLGWRPSCMARTALGQVHFVNERHVNPTFTSSYLSTRISEWTTFTANGASNTTSGTGPNPIAWVPSGATFMKGGRLFQYFIYDGITAFGPYTSAVRQSLQTSGFLCEYVSWIGSYTAAPGTPVLRVVGRTANRLIDPTGFTGMIYASGASNFMSSAYYDADRYGVGIKTRGLQVAANQGWIGGGAFQTDFLFDATSKQDLYQTAELGTDLHISGGVPFVSDGSTAFEQGYEHYPEFALASLNVSSAGVTLPAGQYVYAVDYEWTDGAGLVHRSAPVFTNAFNCPGTGQGCQIWIPPYSVTYRDGDPTVSARPDTPVYANVYRTVVNGSVFYLIDRIRISKNASEVVLYPDPAVASADNVPNGLAQLSTLVYTTGNAQLDEVSVPGTNLMTTHGNRVAQVDETYQKVWFSKEFEEGFAPGYHENLAVDFPDGGDILAIISMDTNFIAMKESSIWYVYGNGPLENGQGEPWPVPQPITTDVGVKNWQSVVRFPDGIMFRSVNGFHVLRRNLQVEYVGEPVQETLATYPNVTSATLVPNKTQIRFSCVNDAGTASTVIVYDYHHGYWFTFDYARLPSSVVSTALTGDPRRYTALCSDATMFREKLPTHATAYKDENSAGTNFFVPVTVTSAPVHESFVQGWQRCTRVQLYGEKLGSCGLRMELMTDYEDSVKQTEVWYPDQLAANGPVNGQVVAHVDALHTRAMAVQARFVTTEGGAGDNGRAMRFVTASFEIETAKPVRPVSVPGQR